MCGVYSRKRAVDFDYSPYLGPDYSVPQRVSTYVANHSAWIDIGIMVRHFKVSFAAKEELSRVPMLGIMARAIGCIFVAREGAAEVREGIVKQIAARQAEVEEKGEYFPLCIFPEGGTSNGSFILQFKRGAF